MADLILSRPVSLSLDEFTEQRDTLTCRKCHQAALGTEHNPNNNGLLLICTGCGSKTPLGPLLYLRQNTKKKTTRREYPEGASLDEVWAKFGNRCVSCSATKDELAFLGIGRHRQHVAQYAEHEHDGPIVPMCEPCHAEATRRQRDVKFWLKRLREVYGAPQSLPVSGSGLPDARVPSNPLPAA